MSSHKIMYVHSRADPGNGKVRAVCESPECATTRGYWHGPWVRYKSTAQRHAARHIQEKEKGL